MGVGLMGTTESLREHTFDKGNGLKKVNGAQAGNLVLCFKATGGLFVGDRLLSRSFGW